VLLIAVATLILVVPADGQAMATPNGPLYRRLLRVEATDSARSETVVDRFSPLGPSLNDETRSLAADDDVALLARALDDVGVDRAAFTTDVARFESAEGHLRHYRALALGDGRTKDGPFMTIAVAVEDDAAAADEARRLAGMLQTGGSHLARRPWHDLLAVQSLETRGRIVVAVLPTTLPMLWLQLARQPDTLVWWSP
jgi:hypothetical protein